MNILFLNHNVKGNGTYIRCFNFAKHLVRFGHSVVILTSAPQFLIKPKAEIIEGVEVICQPEVIGRRARNGGLGPIDTISRCYYVLRKKFDIIENFDHRPAVLYPALVGKYLTRTPLVSEWTDLHGTGGSLNNRPRILRNLIRPYEDFTERKSKKLPEKLIVISSWLGKKAVELGVPESSIIYIPGGSDLDAIKSRPKEEVRKFFGLPLDKKIVAYTAGTHYDSNLFLRTIYNIQKARSDVLLVTTGRMLDRKIREAFYDSNRIIEFGFLPYDKYTALLPAADVFLFPYANKSVNKCRWPNKIGDYMAAGSPIVSNRTGDLIDVFEKYRIGLLASDDPHDMATKTLEILSNEDLCSRMGNKARQTAERHFAWSLMAKKLETCFFEILQRY